MNKEIESIARDLAEEGLTIDEIVAELQVFYDIDERTVKALEVFKSGSKKVEKPESGKPRKLSPYKKEYAETAYNLLLLGKSPADIARQLKVDVYTLNTWRDKERSFSDAWEKAQAQDVAVAKSLYKLAVGYEQEDVKVFQFKGEAVYVPYTHKYQPDLSAIKLILQSKYANVWRDSQYIEQSIDTKVKDLTQEELDDRLAALGLIASDSEYKTLERVDD